MGCDFTGTNFNMAITKCYQFRNCNLTGADLHGCNLQNHVFAGSIMNGVNVQDANLTEAMMSDVKVYRLTILLLQSLLWYPSSISLLDISPQYPLQYESRADGIEEVFSMTINKREIRISP
jgi:hypothetical protein